MKTFELIERCRKDRQSRYMPPSDEEKQYAESYISKALSIMGLSDWTVFVSYKKTKKFRAEIHVVEGARVAHLALARPFWEDSDDLKLWTIAHELIHVHTSEMCQSVEGCFKPHVSESNWESTYYAFHSAEERCVDNLAKAMMSLLPPWNPPKQKEKTELKPKKKKNKN